MYVCMVYTLPLRYQSVVRVIFESSSIGHTHKVCKDLSEIERCAGVGERDTAEK